MKSRLLILVILAYPALSQSQDSTLINKIDSISQFDYDNSDTILYYLTTNDFLQTGSGTQIQLYKFKNKIHRIFSISRHPLGVYAIEFYLHNEEPVFVFETTEYALETAPAWTEKNFKHVHASDHRYYFWNNKLVHSYGTGTDPNRDLQKHSRQLSENCAKIIRWCKRPG